MSPSDLTNAMERLVREEMSAACSDMMWPGPTLSLEDHIHRLVEQLLPVVARAETAAFDLGRRERTLFNRRATAAARRASKRALGGTGR